MKISKIILILLIGCYSCSKTNDINKIIKERYKQSSVNFIPDSAGVTPNYWCTWSAQNFAFDTLTMHYMIGLGDHSIAADNLSEKIVFGKSGWEKQIPIEIKKDLYLMFDVGWDISGGSQYDKAKKWILGTQEVAIDKFPSCTGLPEERLKKLNILTKNAGWKGAAIWIAAQTSMDSKKMKPSENEVESFFRERLRWSKSAGIFYWKVDYGTRGNDLKFRQMLTRLAHDEAPDLWIEHGRGGGPFNDDECPWDDPNPRKTGMYKNWESGNALKRAHDLLEFSDVVRTYDVSSQLSIPTTLDRVSQILNSFKTPSVSKGIINCEDEPYIAAVLGCSMGIMRHPAFVEAKGYNYDPLKVRKQLDAIKRAVNWQRIAPAFKVGTIPILLDSVYLKDYWNFKKGDSWAKWMTGKTVLQAAPARVARGMDLPLVNGEDILPYVICCKFPNGYYAISTLNRTDSIKKFIKAKANVSITCDNPKMIGVFGYYNSLKINFTKKIEINKIFAQDLAGNKAVDITDLVKISSKAIVISRELIDIVGTSASTVDDVSEPGLLLVIEKDDSTSK